MVRIGLVGIGFMGMIHYLASERVRGARVVAICSRDARKRGGDWRAIQGNFGPPGQLMDLSRVRAYPKLDEMLADADVDLVDICLPSHLHPEAVQAALAAGKHVLVEKPIALTMREADKMLSAGRRHGRLLMVAHVVPFFAEFAYALQTVQSGRYGRLLAGHFKRIISRPDWSEAPADIAKSGGPVVDLHIHDTHFIALMCGVPERVVSVGHDESGTLNHVETVYFYDDGPAISCSAGTLAQKGRPFCQGFELYLEKATLAFDLGARAITLMTPDGKIRQPKLSGVEPLDVFAAEIHTAIDGVRLGKEPEALAGQLARDALNLCFKEQQSARFGRPVRIA